ncbi:coiled-coil alpha-helical rod protein 1 isoform X2 [Nematostella vectensis]|uniref:coiled-coil alpha-helical rod protein 1 isoform X2 n=1 Tax=Nematostella vectensis TaxID=45351 RepID=UPI002076FD3B|nr:coiled-coil alpha-helical rod protein 1 isoform X2 [Nematostella vectensis]
MAGKSQPKFLSPAHFEVKPPKPSVKGHPVKLLTPGQCETHKKIDPKPMIVEKPLIKTPEARELDALREEIRQLRIQLREAKDRGFELEEESRKYKVSLQRSRVGDAIDLRRLAEVEEENTVLQAESRKQISLISKLKSDIKSIKEQHDTEVEKLEKETSDYLASLRQLKQELKDKELKYEKDMESLRVRCKKQACSIKELKSELLKAQDQIHIDRSGFEDIIRKNEFVKYQEIEKLEQTLKNCKKQHSTDLTSLSGNLAEKDQVIEALKRGITKKDEEIKALKENTEKNEKDLLQTAHGYRRELEKSQETIEQKAMEFERNRQEWSEVHQTATREQKEKLELKERELQVLQANIEQLKKYIGENLPTIQQERLESENRELHENVITLIRENKTLKSNAELVDIRLSSLNEILTIQEKELCKGVMEAQVTDRSYCNLLNRWRQKVFALLVQLKAQEVSRRKDNVDATEMVQSLRQQVQSTQNEVKILSHTITNREAELKIEANKIVSLTHELQEEKSKEQHVLAANEMYKKAIQTLFESAEYCKPSILEQMDKMNKALAKISVLSQRITFASGRVQFLQDLVTHKEAQWKREVAEALEGKPDDSEKDVPEESSLAYQQLVSEVKQLTRERDMLAARVTKEGHLIDSKVSAVRAEYEERLDMLASNMSQVESELREEREHSSSLREKNEACLSECKETSEEIEQLKVDLAKYKEAAEKDLDKALSEERAKFTEEYAKLEKQFNDARREHMKAVVSLRQAERQLAREKEKGKEQIAQKQKDFDTHMDKYKARMKGVEQERNMLLATVRQEGLKPLRQPMLQHSSGEESENADKENQEVPSAIKPAPKQRPSAKETRKCKRKALGKPLKAGLFEDKKQGVGTHSMVDVLKDLQSLSAAILLDDDENGEKG